MDLLPSDIKYAGAAIRAAVLLVQHLGRRDLRPKERKFFPLRYDNKWLDPPSNFLPTDWCTLQITLSRSAPERNKYKIMAFLSTLAYSQHTKQELVQALLAFTTVPELRATVTPNRTSLHLSEGFSPDIGRLSDISGTGHVCFMTLRI